MSQDIGADRPVTIAFLNPSGALGGAERSLLDVFASLRAAVPDWKLHLIAAAEGPLVDRARRLGVEVSVVRFPEALARLGDGGAGGGGSGIEALVRGVPAILGYRARLRAALRAIGPDLIHTNGFKMHVLGLWSRRRRTPVVWHVHDFVGRRPLMSALLRMHARGCSAVVANSHSVAEDVRAVCGERPPVAVVYNAVDLQSFSPSGPALDLDRLSGLEPAPEGTVRIGLVATLGWWKGHETFLRAIAALPDGLTIRAYVVGGPLYETAGSQRTVDELRDLTAELEIEDRVGFTGFVEDVGAGMRALDIVVHASTEPEPFGLVIAEAMACGRALVASEAGGAAELFVSGREALGHVPGDVADLARQIERLARDPELRAALGRAGREAARSRFEPSRLAEELVPIYRAALTAES